MKKTHPPIGRNILTLRKVKTTSGVHCTIFRKDKIFHLPLIRSTLPMRFHNSSRIMQHNLLGAARKTSSLWSWLWSHREVFPALEKECNPGDEEKNAMTDLTRWSEDIFSLTRSPPEEQPVSWQFPIDDKLNYVTEERRRVDFFCSPDSGATSRDRRR